ncbi:lytic transglycosylase domain-containing protein [Lysinibacillus louembei]|uniref:Lytic transglycosylase domain-containing protein n=1 Tax=Lysinibacillus louembei TaxID=1470088 RepID=A0ABZ0RZV0_9BACI|nr:lytic transglycosylase domain-containing protein [Lysinibacillus louembei]WPK12333.1 lytic transglycosylase domain-containing protein [Lysinibacillus louembei]
MDIKAMKILMEIQAMQSVGNTTLNNSNNTLFNEMLGDILQAQQPTGLTAELGSEFSLSQTSGLIGPQTKYLDAFLYEGAIASSPLEQYVKDYTGQEAYNELLAGASRYKETIAKAAATYNLPEKLIAAVMKQESNFNPEVVSTAGAVGLMQLMPGTSKYLGVQNPTDAEQNIMGGAKYLRQMLNQFGQNLETALAAYNAGPGNVKKYDGIPPFKETQNYVQKVLNYYNA